MLMTGNLAIAAFLFVLTLICRDSEPITRIEFLLTLLVPVSLYIEFLRLWRARNLQVAIYAIGFRRRYLKIR